MDGIWPIPVSMGHPHSFFPLLSCYEMKGKARIEYPLQKKKGAMVKRHIPFPLSIRKQDKRTLPSPPQTDQRSTRMDNKHTQPKREGV